MKKLPLILSIVSLIGVLVLFVLNFTVKADKVESNSNSTVQVNNGDLKIAYVLTDSVLVNYQLAIDLNADFMEKQQQYNAEFTKKRTALEQQAVAFQEKVQRGGFLTEDRAIKERDRILGEEQEMKRMDYELSNKLSEMEQKINVQLVDSIVNYVKEYNKQHNYTYIFSNSGSIIVGAQQFNISKDIVEGLNSRYKKAK
ncbi:MAG: OmpH family outer membrane protein [Prolixibacteraceae bacterium]|nr:OmpH family outer membrane protein [Prolixibacteraceae bacterium]